MKKYIFSNGNEATVCFEKAYISDVCIGGKTLAQGEIPFYALKLRNQNGQGRIISAQEGAFISFDGERACYSHAEVNVTITVKAGDNDLIWRISVQNKTEDLLEWVELMSFGVGKKLQDEEGGKGAILFPYNEGCLVTDMDKRHWSPFPYIEPDYPSQGKYCIFPNMLSSQFMAYITDGKGIYLGMHDAERTTKHIDFRYYEESIKLQMRVFCNVNYGQDYQMPFDCVMTFFEGEWQDVCEIYREWFYENLPSGLTKIKDCQNLPKWYSESPIIITYPIRGQHDTDDMTPNKLFPYINALPILEEFQTKTESKVMSLLMHWEGTAPWAPPYVWPPYGGEEVFNEFLQKAHEQELLVGVYCSGMGWTQQSNIVSEYNRENDYENEHLSEIMCSNSNGEIKSVICEPQRRGYDICPALDKSKRVFAEEIGKVVKSGVDYVQVLDQNHGGCGYFCYSSEHGHVPAPGKWQQEETLKLLQGIDNGKVLLGCESAAAEPFISALKFSDNRYELNYYIGLPVPAYSYIYHEFVNNFMGNQICQMLSKEEYNYPYRVAYSFIAGDMLTAVITENGEVSHSWCDWIQPKEKMVDKETALTALKNLNAWRIKGGKNYLHYGKMVKPLPIQCGINNFIDDYGKKVVVDEALTSAYEYNGRKLQFIANYNLHPVTVSLGQSVTVYKNPEMTDIEYGVSVIEVPALSAVAIEVCE